MGICRLRSLSGWQFHLDPRPGRQEWLQVGAPRLRRPIWHQQRVFETPSLVIQEFRWRVPLTFLVAARLAVALAQFFHQVPVRDPPVAFVALPPGRMLHGSVVSRYLHTSSVARPSPEDVCHVGRGRRVHHLPGHVQRQEGEIHVQPTGKQDATLQAPVEGLFGERLRPFSLSFRRAAGGLVYPTSAPTSSGLADLPIC